MSSESPAVFKPQHFCFFVWFLLVLEDLLREKKNKQTKKKRAWEPKKTNKSSYLIDVWRLWMRPIESHFVLLCWYFSAKPTHCRKMSTPALVSISHLGADRGTVQSYWKSARCFLNVFHLRSKCEIKLPTVRWIIDVVLIITVAQD